MKPTITPLAVLVDDGRDQSDRPETLPSAWLLTSTAPSSRQHEAMLRKSAHDFAHSFSGIRSFSYRYPYAVVAVHDRALGVDIEYDEPWTAQQLTSVLTPEEAAASPQLHLAATIWSGKEALAKALGDAVRYDPRWLGSPHFWHQGVQGRWHAARLAVPLTHAAWICWRM